MDPNACLERIRTLAKYALGGDGEEGEYQELAEHCQALDEWIRNGGFLPESWLRELSPSEHVAQAYLGVPENSEQELLLEQALHLMTGSDEESALLVGKLLDTNSGEADK